MDRLDKISIIAIILLVISSVVLASVYQSEAGPEKNVQKRIATAGYAPVNDEVVTKVKVIKNLMESNNLGKAETMVKKLIKKYPYEGDPHIVMGDIFMRKQQLLMAMPEYKEAVDMNPDYLDKSTPLFQGKKIRVAVAEALAEVETRLDEKPGDKLMKKSRKTIYYLKRKIAGSCG
jgi:lipopolysaccharide biosynthesis regulator YciM